jgi:hypothetical protein
MILVISILPLSPKGGPEVSRLKIIFVSMLPNVPEEKRVIIQESPKSPFRG